MQQKHPTPLWKVRNTHSPLIYSVETSSHRGNHRSRGGFPLWADISLLKDWLQSFSCLCIQKKPLSSAVLICYGHVFNIILWTPALASAINGDKRRRKKRKEKLPSRLLKGKETHTLRSRSDWVLQLDSISCRHHCLVLELWSVLCTSLTGRAHRFTCDHRQ